MTICASCRTLIRHPFQPAFTSGLLFILLFYLESFVPTHYIGPMIRIGALISGSGTNLAAVMRACDSGTINGQVVFVGSDNPAATGLEKAENQGIPTFVVDYTRIIGAFRARPDAQPLPPDFDLQKVAAFLPNKSPAFLKTRVIAEAALLANMAEHSFDLLILAGFMRNLTPYFIDRVNMDPARPRIMNIHPALLPAFPGTDGYGDTFRYGCKVGGCTVHFIDYGEDTGPIIGQKAFTILPEDTIDTIREKGLKLEWELFPECIQLFAENRLKIESREIGEKDGKPVTRNVVTVA